MLALKRHSLLLAILILVTFFSALLSINPKPFHSVEVQVAEVSPNGESGGVVVPASCPSDAHVSGQCDPPTLDCAPSEVRAGSNTTCTWTCQPGASSSSGLNFTTGGGTSGSAVVQVDATGSLGVQCSPGIITTTVTVTALSPTLLLSATPSRVRSGGATSIEWSAVDVSSCTLTGTGVDASCSGAACANAHTTATGALAAQTIYTLSCTTSIGTQTTTATIFITPSVCEVGTAGCPE